MRLSSYALWLFDLDGLLVETEQLHLEAYRRLCRDRGFELPWNLEDFMQVAHRSSSAIKEEIFTLFPALRETSWRALYEKKKEHYLLCLQESKLQLMPGAKSMLLLSEHQAEVTCVVTHSPKEQVEAIRAQIPLLNLIPHWITREDYDRPKPDPQCYKQAINLYQKEPRMGESVRAIGFEDSARGLMALMGSSAQPVLIAEQGYAQLSPYQERYVHFPTFLKLLEGQELPIEVKMVWEEERAARAP